MKKLYTICFGLVLVVTLTAVVGQSQQIIEGEEIKEDAKAFMAQKLEHNKQIVSGLALENFSDIEASAEKLQQLSYESNWKTFQSEQYLDMSKDFRQSAERLEAAAKDKNLDGTTLAYFEVMLNCVRCHKYVRKITHSKEKPESQDAK